MCPGIINSPSTLGVEGARESLPGAGPAGREKTPCTQGPPDRTRVPLA